jgi:uncharacterized protein (TIGR00251 family)
MDSNDVLRSSRELLTLPSKRTCFAVICVRLNILVTPNAKDFSVSWDESRKTWRVKLRSRAEKGRANAELLRELGYIFGCPVTIISGAANRRKALEINADEGYVREKLEREAAKAA